MEQNNRMMGQRFTYQNEKYDQCEYLKIYTGVRQGQVTYTRRYKEEKSRVIFEDLYANSSRPSRIYMQIQRSKVTYTCWCTNFRIQRVLTMVLSHNIEHSNGYLISSKITTSTNVVLTHGID